ncbi:ejaculatory bulb-specific protein 3-like [Copidosoma floridanum]|uniref:ejaculatory bulb-specific protein 3-like n=1 Tax=Copidosoma floridanum TaxID=29053 RepID=UPI0006C93C4F|nr:ejaculatory bulb-specific protein 3-like [Copidosoma floridanum]
MDKRMCWLALCWWLGGSLDNKYGESNAGASGYPWPKPHTYNTRWDKVNFEALLGSRRLMQHYFNCLMSKGPCPPDGLELKRALPEALANACAKCSQSQIETSIKMIRYLREFEPVKFQILANKFDPRGIYRKRYLEPPSLDDNSLNR